MLCASRHIAGAFVLFYTRPLGHLLHSLGFQFHLYADDSQLITSLPGGTPADQSIVINLVQNGVKQIGEWMKQNKLKLNEENTEFIVFGTIRQLKNLKINSFLLDGDIKKHRKKSRSDYVPKLGYEFSCGFSL